MFTKAVKHEAKLRLAIAGPSGSGKTYSALAIASSLAGDGRIAVVDTEHGSAAKYADIFNFDVLEMTAPYHPDRFAEAIREASQAGYSVVILDSLSHAWNGAGGLLDIVESISRRMKTANSFAAWKDATPIQNAFIEAIVSAPLHIIATMRSKQEYVLEAVERNGRTVTQPKKVGMAPVQRDGFEYEFDVFFDMDIDNNAIVSKTRCPSLAGQVIQKPGGQVATVLKDWLSGVPAVQKPTTNGNGSIFVSQDSAEYQEFISLGGQIYGDDWDNKRGELVYAVTKSTRNSLQMTPDHLGKLMKGLRDKAEKMKVEQEPLFGDEPQPAQDTTYID